MKNIFLFVDVFYLFLFVIPFESAIYALEESSIILFSNFFFSAKR
jgi:hypothetical protein